MSRSLPLLLLLSLLTALRAETPPGAPADNAAPPAAAAAEAAPVPGPEPDKELDAIRGLLEAAGLRVTKLARLDDGNVLAMGEVRLALSPNERLRQMDLLLFVSRATHPGCWRLVLTLPFDEQPRPDAAQAVLRAEADQLIPRSRTLRRVLAAPSEDDEDEEEADGLMVVASHYASVADPRVLAAFIRDLSLDADELLDIEDENGGYLMTRAERRQHPVRTALHDHARRLRERLVAGLPAFPAQAGPATEDPASHASQLLDARTMDAVLRAEDASPLLAELGDRALPIPAREAFRLHLLLNLEKGDEAMPAKLKSLAYDPATGAPRDAWALHFWAGHLLRTLPEEGGADQVVEALDALRLATRLGCERALGFYLNILAGHDEPLVGGESHWEERARWEALFPHFDPHFPGESLEVERDYRAGDRSPIRFGVEASGEELRLVGLAVDEMNAARRARGWKTFEIMVEKGADEPADRAAKKTDPADAGSGGAG